MTRTCITDLLIVGGGPAGLSAAINGASEGLRVRLLDNGNALGGQARESSAIENYPGFPGGITGDDLMTRIVQQARKFDTGLVTPIMAQSIERREDGLFRVQTDDYGEFLSRSVLLTLGVNYRRLPAKDAAQFTGRGLFYGVPSQRRKGNVRHVAIIGGANSAGQAALNLSRDTRISISLYIRRTIGAAMSDYLIQRIRTRANIEVCENCEVIACYGDNGRLAAIDVQSGETTDRRLCDAIYVFIGASPRTYWIKDFLRLDEKNFICTWPDHEEDHGMNYCTSVRGVFCAGDVRSGSTKRIATAIGEGAGALQMVHKYLAM